MEGAVERAHEFFFAVYVFEGVEEQLAGHRFEFIDNVFVMTGRIRDGAEGLAFPDTVEGSGHLRGESSASKEEQEKQAG